MGRSFKKRKIKKVRRMKLSSFAEPVKEKKKIMKTWEWWLLGLAFLFGIVFLIVIFKTGSMTPSTATTTPTAAVTPVSK